MYELGQQVERLLRQTVLRVSSREVMPSAKEHILKEDLLPFFQKAHTNLQRAIRAIGMLTDDEYSSIVDTYNQFARTKQTTVGTLKGEVRRTLFPSLKRLESLMSEVVELTKLAMFPELFKTTEKLLERVEKLNEQVKGSALEYVISWVNGELGITEMYGHISPLDALLNGLLSFKEDLHYDLENLLWVEEYDKDFPDELLPARFRNKAAREVYNAIKEFTHKGRNIEEINRELKGDIIKALGGEKATFIIPLDVPTNVHEREWEKIKKKVERVISEALRNKGMLALLPPEAATALEANQGWIVEATNAILSKLEASVSKIFLTEGKWLKENFIEAFITPLKQAAAKVVGENALARWTPERLETFLGKARSQVWNLISSVSIPPEPYLAVFISVDMADLFRLGTSQDVNVKSCVWTGAGAHTIPSLIFAQNLAVGFAFLLPKKPEVPPKSYEEIVGAGGRLMGRFILSAHNSYTLRVQGYNQYWHKLASELNIQEAVEKFVNNLKIKVRKPTRYLYKPPAI